MKTVVIIVILMASSLHIQTWPPEADAIFAPGVEVLEVTFSEDVLPTDIPPPTPIDKAATFDSFPVPLPSGYTWDVASRAVESTPVLPTRSPDERKIVLLGRRDREIHVLAHDTVTRVFTDLGAVNLSPSVSFGMWFGNDVALLSTQYESLHSVEQQRVILIDLRDGSLREFGPAAVASETQVLESPTRLVMMLGAAPDCSLMIYTIESREVVEYPAGSLCFREAGDPLGVGYYRDVVSDGRAARVVRFNPLTGEQAMLYEGQVEKIVGILDDQYLMIVVDTNSFIDQPPGQIPDRHVLDAQMLLIELTTGRELFAVPASQTNLLGFWTPLIHQFTENWFQVDNRYIPAEINRLVHVKGEMIEQIELDAVVANSIGGGWVILSPSGNFDGPFRPWIKLYNLNTRETIPVIERRDDNYMLYIGLRHVEDDVFNAQASFVENGIRHVTNFTIRVAGMSS